MSPSDYFFLRASVLANNIEYQGMELVKVSYLHSGHLQSIGQSVAEEAQTSCSGHRAGLIDDPMIEHQFIDVPTCSHSFLPSKNTCEDLV